MAIVVAMMESRESDAAKNANMIMTGAGEMKSVWRKIVSSQM